LTTPPTKIALLFRNGITMSGAAQKCPDARRASLEK